MVRQTPKSRNVPDKLGNLSLGVDETLPEQSNPIESSTGCENSSECYCPGPQRAGREPICIWRATARANHSDVGVHQPSGFAGWDEDDRVVFETYFKDPPKYDGVYLEMGAYDGVSGSNTLFFDEALGWSGVLIESSPSLFERVRTRRPHAIKIRMAACQDPVGQIEFLGGGGPTDGAVGVMPPAFRGAFHGPTAPRYNVSCAPLGTMLRYAGVTHIDFFSLDVENAELVALLTLDFSVPIHVLVIEINDLDMARNDVIHALLGYHGFVFRRRAGNGMNEIWENPNYADLMAVRAAWGRGARVRPHRPLHPGG